MQHTSISQNSMKAMQRFESAALALHDWAILTAVGAAVFTGAVVSQPGQQLPLLTLAKLVGGVTEDGPLYPAGLTHFAELGAFGLRCSACSLTVCAAIPCGRSAFPCSNQLTCRLL